MTQLRNANIAGKRLSSAVVALPVVTYDESGSFVSPATGSTQVSIKEILSSSGGSLVDSSNVSLGVTIRAGSAAGTEYTDGDTDNSVSGQALLFDNSTNTLRSVTISRGLPVNIVQGQSTVTTVSTGSVRVHQSTASDLNVTVAGYSTIATVSTGSVRVHQSTAADLNVTVAGYSTVASISTGSVRVHQSTASDLNVTVAGYVAPSTVQTISTGSVRVHQSTAGDLQVTATPASGSTWAVRPLQSSQADLRITAYQSTAADLNVTVAGYSTTVNVSTGSVRVHQSTAGDLQVTASQNSTAWSVLSRVTTSSGGGVEGSTITASGNLLGVHVRPVMPTMLSTTAVITSTNSTAVYSLVSSAAGVRHKVYAYFVGSTHTVGSTLVFMSSGQGGNAGHDLFHIHFGSGSSGITGANMGITPPGFFFGTVVANALSVRIEGGSSAASTVIARVSFSYFTEA